MKTVQDIMTQNPATCTVDTPLQEVAKMMAEYDCGLIPVTDQTNKPVGTVTDRDITIRTLAHGKNPMQMVAGEVMTGNPVTVTPEMSFEECCNLMEKNQIRRVIVTGENGSIVGMVAQADVAQEGSSRQAAEVVKEVSKGA